jgi:Protein of unknown function (DUF2752)
MVLNPESGCPTLLKRPLRTLSQQQRLNRWTVLGLVSAPLLGSGFYRAGCHLPFLQCPLRSLTGIPCPTCGMTRSFTAIAQGDLGQAVQYHLFGPAVFILFLMVALHLLRELKANQPRSAFYSFLFRPIAYSSVAISYFGYYGVRLFFLERSGELYRVFWASSLGLWLSHFYLS